MAMSPRKVRLPELPIFRKFSLALRQEFGKPEEVLKALEESSKQIEAMLGEGGARVRPALRAGSASALGSGSPAEGRQGSDPEELSESPESFLKDSVAGSFRRLDPPEDSPPGDATRAMRPPKRLRPRPPRSPDSRRSSLQAEPASGQADAPDSGVPEKKSGPRQRRSKKTTTSKGSSRRAATAKTAAPARDEGPSEPEDKSATHAGQVPSKVPEATEAGTAPARDKGGSAPARDKGGSAPATDDEADFWGDERPWGKSRRGKGRSSTKEGSSPVRIVRIGDEGKPVHEKDGSADEGG